MAGVLKIFQAMVAMLLLFILACVFAPGLFSSSFFTLAGLIVLLGLGAFEIILITY